MKKIFLSILLLIFSNYTHAIKTVNEIPKYCAHKAKALAQSEDRIYYNHSRRFRKNLKVLYLDNFSMPEVFRCLTLNTRKHLGGNWNITSYYVPQNFCTQEFGRASHGIPSIVLKSKNNRVNFHDLQIEYGKVIHKLKRNWHLLRKNQITCVLTKTPELKEEWVLISNLMQALNFYDYKIYNHYNKIHLEIRAESWKRFQSIFKLEIKMKTIDDAPEYFTNLAVTLSEQPLFRGGLMFQKSKLLPLKDFFTCTICNILNSNTRKALNKTWDIRFPGPCKRSYETPQRKVIEYCIELLIYDEIQLCHPSLLEKEYKKVIDKLKSNWQIPDPDKYKGELSHMNLENWRILEKEKKEFLIKEEEGFSHKDFLKEEDILIRCFMKLFGLKEETQAKVYRSWLKDTICVLVHEDFWQHFQSIFRLKIIE